MVKDEKETAGNGKETKAEQKAEENAVEVSDEPKAIQYSSLFIFSDTNPIRRGTRFISTSKGFEYFILVAILVNCALMAINSQLPKEDLSLINKVVEQAENYLLGIFGLEMILNIITMGFILHPGSYIRNPWNVLDFIVVVTGVLSVPQLNIMKGGSVKALRAMRVLRPLKLVSGVPSLQVVMTSIAKSLVPLSNVCLLVAFVIVIYAVIGLQMLSGLFNYTCMNSTTGAIYQPGLLCSVKNGRLCPSGTVCQRFWVGPNNGITSFNNIFISMLTVFTCITCEGWTSTMYWSFDVVDRNGILFWVYYYSLNIVGAQFMLNLVLGVLSGEFGKEGERLKNRAEFLAQMEATRNERAVERYDDWIDKGTEVAITEELEKPADEKKTKKQVAQEAEQKASLMRIRVRKLVKHSAFFWFVMTCVFLNTAAVATQHYNQPELLSLLQEIASILFISIFFIEMCLKFYAFGWRGYFKSSFNTFDLVIVVCGTLEVILVYVAKINLGISVLRALKLLKLFKFTRYWNSLKNLIGALMAGMQAILSLMLLLLLFLVIFALLGMTLFGGKFSYKLDPPRTNFDDFWNSFLAVFQILTGEDWNQVMYDGVLANGGPQKTSGLLHSLYFVGLVIIGNYVLLNVFLAIAVDNLTEADLLGGDEDKEEQDREQKKNEIREQYAPKAIEGSKEKTNGNDHPPSKVPVDQAEETENEFSTMYQTAEGGHAKPGENFLENLKNPGRMTGNMPGGPGAEMLPVNTFFVCFPGNPIRKGLHKLVTSFWFDPFILICIIISSGLLACEDTVNQDAKINTVLTYFDFIFTPIFAIEVVIKLLNYGALFHEGAYFRDAWNVMDALVVGSAIASLVLSNDKTASPQSQKIVKVLRVLRVLRPLKAVNKSKKLKAVFQCMLFSLKNVINILVITIMFLFVFAAMGVQLFVGKFYHCTDASKMTNTTCQGNFIALGGDLDYDLPTVKPREWLLYDWNFDNVANAMITLFTSSTGEGWPTVMFHAIDATKKDEGPIENSNPAVALFFVFFVVILSFFFLNIFVALIILTFQEEGAKEEGDCELDRNQRDCVFVAMTAQPLQLFVPEDETSFQGRVYRLVNSTPFDSMIMLLIMGNTIVLMISFDDQPTAYGKWLDNLNDYFNYLFTAELLLKLIALKLNYFKDGWNVFDLVIIFGSWADFIVNKTMSAENLAKLPIDTSIFRLFRAARLVKLLNRSKTIKVLLYTFIQSFKALPYVGALIFLLFFIYAIIGMQMFSHISLEQGNEPWSEIHRQNNFRSFFQAFQVLFRSATGENWPNIMKACSGPAMCDPKIEGKTALDTCGSAIAYPYFITFIFFCSFLMLNLFVAVIMDNFAFLCQDESILGAHHLDDFLEAWSEYDPRAIGRIRHTEVCNLLRQLAPPLGLGTKCPRVVIYKRMIRMNMLLHDDDTVDFSATLFHLVRTGLNICTENNNLRSNDVKIRQLLKRVWPNLTKKTMDRVVPKRKKDQEKKTLARVYCSKLIYEHYKHLKKTRK